MKKEYLVNKLTAETIHQYESYAKGSFGGTGVDAAILADNRVAHDPYVFSAKANSIARNMSKVIKSLKMSGDSDSRYLRGAGDTMWMFTKGILNDNEVLISNRRLLKYNEAFVVRFPHSARSEFAYVKMLGKSEYIERIEESDLKPTFKMLAIEVAKSLPETTFLCSGSSVFKGLTGGSDFDTDGFMFLVGEDAQIFTGWKQRSVDIPDDIGEASSVTFNNFSELMEGVFNANISTGNTDVGEFCVATSTAITVLQNLDNAEIIAKLQENISKEFGNEFDGNIEYSRYYIGNEDIAMEDVRNAKIESITMSFVASDRSAESIKAYLEDMLEAAPAVIGMIIDSAKTGLKVWDPLSFLFDGIKQARRSAPPKIKWNEEKSKFFVEEDSRVK
ncbi:MAG: hypothetical protein ACFN0J_10510 [Segatella salivae]